MNVFFIAIFGFMLGGTQPNMVNNPTIELEGFEIEYSEEYKDYTLCISGVATAGSLAGAGITMCATGKSPLSVARELEQKIRELKLRVK